MSFDNSHVDFISSSSIPYTSLQTVAPCMLKSGVASTSTLALPGPSLTTTTGPCFTGTADTFVQNSLLSGDFASFRAFGPSMLTVRSALLEPRTALATAGASVFARRAFGTRKGISAFPTLVLTLELHHAIASCQAFVVVRNTIVAAHRVQNF